MNCKKVIYFNLFIILCVCAVSRHTINNLVNENLISYNYIEYLQSELEDCTKNNNMYKNREEDEKEFIYCWVYENSTKITEEEAIKIVDLVFENTANPYIYLSLFKRESSFFPGAVSKKGAIGLGQVMPDWVPELKKNGIIEKKEDLFDIEKNILATKYVFLVKNKLAEGNITETLNKYLGCEHRPYSDPILSDYVFLVKKHYEINRREWSQPNDNT